MRAIRCWFGHSWHMDRAQSLRYGIIRDWRCTRCGVERRTVR